MLEGFSRREIRTSGATIVTVVGGSGPPVLLLHGNPFTHLSWHKVAPVLARDFTVVCTDLRGYGDSSKPPGGAEHANYSFRAMAQDQLEVMGELGFDRFAAAGHDRGARVLALHSPRLPAEPLRGRYRTVESQHAGVVAERVRRRGQPGQGAEIGVDVRLAGLVAQ